MNKRLLSLILSCVLIVLAMFSPCQVLAEDVHSMDSHELEAYISYLQIVLQNKRKEEGIVTSPDEEATIEIVVDVSENETEENGQIEVNFNNKVYIGTYQGDMKDDKPDGNGTFEGYCDGKKFYYNGTWETGQLKGKGTVEAEAYTLHFDDSQGAYDRTGPYIGDVVDGLPEGKGTFNTVNSNNIPWQYTGEWKSGTFHGQGKQSWERDYTTIEGNFADGEFSPKADEAIVYRMAVNDFYCSAKARTAMKEMDLLFSGSQKSGEVPSTNVDWKFDLNQFKKNASNYGEKLIYISNASVFQVLTGEAGDKTVERILMETADGTIYYGFYYGKSNIVEGMRVAGYVLPAAWDTYETVDKREVWAVVCAIADYFDECYETLSRGDNSEEVWKMKYRLQELGYFLPNASLSYAYNATCEERVSMFQAVNGLSATGVADNETLKVLYSNSALRNPD